MYPTAIPTIKEGKATYLSGQYVPSVGSNEYNQAVANPEDLRSFKTANPTLNFEQSDLNAYNSATAKVPQTIGSGSLQSQSPISLTTPTPSIANAVIENTTSLNNSTKAANEAQASQQNELTKIQAQKDASLGDLGSVYKELGLVGQKTIKAEEDAGIPNLKKESDEITNQIEARSLAYRRQIEDLDKTFTGTLSGKTQAVNAIQRDAARELADLSIIQNARNRNLATAQSIVERKVQLMTEDLKNRADYLKFVYSENKSNFDKKEQRIFDQATKEADRKYQEARDTAKALEDAKLKYISLGIEKGVSNLDLQNIQSARNQEELSRAIGAISRTPGAVSTQVVELKDGSKVLINSKTGETIKSLDGGSTGDQNLQQQATAKANIDLIDSIKVDKYLNTTVGPNPLARIDIRNAFTGGKSNLIASVEQLRNQLTLDNLVKAKANGATFGALSDSELSLLASSASKLGTWAIKDGNGNITGYKASAKDFKAELDKIANFAKLDYILKGGNVADVNAQVMNDGTVWVTNSDGTVTQIK